MTSIRYKHFIECDTNGSIIKGWTDAIRPDLVKSDSICINSSTSYQFRLTPDGEGNPNLFTEDMIPLYKWDGSQVIPRTEAEIQADRDAMPAAAPSQMDIIEAQVSYTAMMTDTVLEV